jgi:hypothetical protein
MYNISGMDFGTCYSMANNVKDWSEVSVWGFAGEFQPPIPYCDESYNGQFLTVVNGAPAWTSVSTSTVSYDERTQTLSIDTTGGE